ncbi:uncharacterized protein LOC131679452 [Topomyia yanbarensis]|uniref:uncharacterized protein LOC131679452 n=1 Tax=Topomyia yanbarensis TaxID=2498891 RepID=UPI00273BDD02|nr:uncharacterized protein LOC131679452 [Topomyia yanbarensis]
MSYSGSKSGTGEMSKRPKNTKNDTCDESVKTGGDCSDDVVVVDQMGKTIVGQSCKSCRELDTDEMVQCDQCDGWHHYDCVGVTDEVVNQSWSCTSCKTTKWTQRATTTTYKDSTCQDAQREYSFRRRSSVSELPTAKEVCTKTITLKSTHSEKTGNYVPAPGLLKQLPKLRPLKPSAKLDHLLNSRTDSRKEKLFVPSADGLPEIELENASSGLSCSSSQRSARNRAKLQLLKLQEEREYDEQMAERRRAAEKEEAEKHKVFLAQKYKILEDLHQRAHLLQEEKLLRPRQEQLQQAKQSNHISLEALPRPKQTIPPKSNFCIPGNIPQSTQVQYEDNLRRQTGDTDRRTHGAVPYGRSHQPLINSTIVEDDFDQFQFSRSQIAARQSVSKDLPIFSGNPEDWPIFLSMFNSTTAMCGFTEDENLVRLQRSLKGKAYEAVKCRLMHPGNVRGVMDTLRMLYGQPEVIVHSLIAKISSLPSIREDRLETLVDFAVHVQNFCATVESCGLKEYMYNITLLHQLVSKLPPTLKLSWAQHRRELLTVNLATFSAWIYSLAEAASSVTFPAISLDTKPAPNDICRSKKGNIYLNAHSETTVEYKNKSNSCPRSLEEAAQAPVEDTCPVCKEGCKSVDRCKRFLELSRDSRWDVVREFGLCRTCLRHHKGNCRAKPCGKHGCEYRHHELLHNDQKEKYHTNTPHGDQEPSQPEAASSGNGCHTHQTTSSSVLFRYLPVILFGREKVVHTFAFLDEGSALTLVDQDLADELQLDGTLSPLCLRWTGGTQRYEKQSRIVKLHLSAKHNEARKFQLEDVRTVNELMLPLQTLDIDELVDLYPHLKGLPIESYQDARPRLLIGMKHAQLGLTLKSREGEFGQPIAMKTRLGWTVCGGMRSGETLNMHHYIFHVCACDEQTDEDLHKTMKEYFSLDSLGVTQPNKLPLSSEDGRAQSLLVSLTHFNGERYETGLLWRYNDVRLPDNRDMALRRHQCLEHRMVKNRQLAEVLQQKIADYAAKGYIRRLSDDEVKQQISQTWFLPVFPVMNPNKPGKIRIVWDAAAKAHGRSLNSALLKGPDLLCSLLAILLRFRLHPVAVTGDICEMFHQVLIREEDQRYQCFFWTDENNKLVVYAMRVMTFGACCSPSTAQYVKNVNAERFKMDYPEAYEAITKSHYVDDMLISVGSEDEAIQLAKDVRHVHAQGGFHIRNWISNSRVVTSALQETDTEEKSLDLSSGLSTEKVLGMWWNTYLDVFTYKVGWNRYDEALLKGGRRPTKREVLRVLMTIYDPLGLIAHFLAYLKVLLQDIWRSGVAWDEEIDDDAFDKWLLWIKVLPQVENVRIARCYCPRLLMSEADVVQLHTFVDAGKDGMAAVSFLRIVKNGNISCSLVTAKTRVAPLKLTSIPRLELQAAVIGARLARTVIETLGMRLTKKVYWSDSRDVLCWINSHRRRDQFVGFRVAEILETTEAREWRYVPSRLNVADDATKWNTLPDLSVESRWFNGSNFLWSAEDKWPQLTIQTTATDIRLEEGHLTHHFLPESIIHVQDYSTWVRLRRVVAWILRFIANCRLKLQKKRFSTGSLTVGELHLAETYLIRSAQQECFSNEVHILRNTPRKVGELVTPLPKSSPLYKQTPWMDECGILRMKTRIAACQYATEGAKQPIILPRKHHITTLIISHYHNKYHHQNHETVINELRQIYHIGHLRSCFNQVRRDCQRCKIASAKPNPPIMADLPPGRLAAFERPFTHTGVDYFGPIQVAVGRRIEKRWGMLATCLTVRAIHIEVVHSLTTSSCIMAIRNFVARRGQPRKFYSDRGTNFIGAEREIERLGEAVDHDEIIKELTSSVGEWTFNPPLAPHMGGSWERLIRTVKNNLMVVCSTKTPSDEVLRNLLTEIENIVNSRPLTHVPVDDDSGPALTPNHFLLGSSNGTKPLVTADDSGIVLKQNWCASQILANMFWKRWVSDYLPEITRRTKWFMPVKPIVAGDIVLIVDPKMPRNCWPKGTVISTIISRDDQVRSATVRTATGIYERPASKLAVLDVRRVEQ